MALPEPFYRGKVRDLYPVDDESMIIVASDRISAFDVVFPEPIPDKGKILTEISNMWFQSIRSSDLPEQYNFADHMISSDISDFPEPYRDYEPFAGRAVYVKKAKRVDFECVVRGYLAGSGWKEYSKSGTVCGHQLPKGLEMSSRLPEPIFTPSTKAPEGEHDENITVEKMKQILGTELTNRLETVSIELYKFAATLMSRAGIILCDTKFEFALEGDRLILIDEVLTPDSSRYWDAAQYKTGISPPGFDKQFIRDYLETTDWNKNPPPPPLPEEVIEKTGELYKTIMERIGTVLPGSQVESNTVDASSASGI